MSASSEPGADSSRTAAENALRKQLDALAAGKIDNAVFLRNTLQRLRANSDESWEALSLLDQYHRLGKIKADAFRELKTKIAEYAMGSMDIAATSVAPIAPVARVASEAPAIPTPATPAATVVTVAPVAPASPIARVAAAPGAPLAPVATVVAAPVAPPAPVAPAPTVAAAPPAPVSPAPTVAAAPLAPISPAPTVAAAPVAPVAPAAPIAAPPVARAAAVVSAAPTASPTPPPPPPAAASVSKKTLPEAPIHPPAPEQSVTLNSLKDSTAKQSTSGRSALPPEPPRDARVGDILRRRYRLESVLGTGSMGTVYEASDPLRLDLPPLGQRMAVKVLHGAVTKRLELLQELRREFQDLQLLSHPNILRVYEFERDGPLAFFTMELLSGLSLPRLLSARQHGPLPRALALAMIRDLASALDHAHSHNLLHGDINPQNIFITTRGEVRLLNFGKAQRAGISPITVAEEPLTTSSATPGYASCQVLEGDQRDVQDDLFSLACVACLILSGLHPYRDNSAIEARAMHLRPRRPRGLSHGQWSALRAALQFDRKKRPADIATWMAQFDLRGAAARLPPLSEMIEVPARISPRAARLAALAAVIIALGAAYYMTTRNGGRPQLSSGGQDAMLTQSSPPPAAPPIAVAPKALEPTPAPVQAPATDPLPIPAPPPASATEPIVASTPQTKLVESNLTPAPAPAASPVPEAPTPSTGRTKVEMIADTVEALPGDHAVQVTVRRRGSLRGETRFNWWTESGTAKPGADFVAVVPRVERMVDGQSSATLLIAVTDVLRAQPKSFYVVIDEAEGGATLNGRRLTMVTLQ